MVTDSLREKTGFAKLAEYPGENGSWCFVGDLMRALSAQGVTELWFLYEPSRGLYQALGIINRHAWKMANHFDDQQGGEIKARAYRRISFAVQPSEITGSFGNFWGLLVQHYPVGRSDGCYIIPFSRPFSEESLAKDYERDYANLLRGYARLIQRKIYGR